MELKKFSNLYTNFLQGLILFLIIFIPYREVLSYYTTSSVKALPDLFILLLFIMYVLKNKFRLKFNSIDFAYIAFLLVAFVSTVILNKVGIKSYILEARSIVLYYILYFMVRNTKLSDNFYELFSKIIFYNTILLVLLSIIEKVSNKIFLFPLKWAESIIYADNFVRAYGMFNNPNTYAAYLLFAIIIMFYFEHVLNFNINRLFYIFSISGIVLTASRSTMISLGLFIIFALIVYRKKDILITFGSSILISLIIIFSINNFNVYYTKNFMNDQSKINDILKNTNSAANRFNELTDDEILDKSGSDGRVYSVRTGIKIFRDYPILGTGFGTYGDAASLIIQPNLYKTYNIRKDFYADNEYIKVLVETGALGTVLYLVFLGAILFKYKKNSYKILSCIILGFLGLFYNIFEIQILSFLFWFLLSLPESNTKLINNRY